MLLAEVKALHQMFSYGHVVRAGEYPHCLGLRHLTTAWQCYDALWCQGGSGRPSPHVDLGFWLWLFFFLLWANFSKHLCRHLSLLGFAYLSFLKRIPNFPQHRTLALKENSYLSIILSDLTLFIFSSLPIWDDSLLTTRKYRFWATYWVPKPMDSTFV